MNTKIIFFLLTVFLISLQGISQETSLTSNDLTINVLGIKKIKGSFFIAVFNNIEDYDMGSSRAIRKIKVPVKGKTQTLKINDLEYGAYGVQMYQDINENEVLDKNFLGIPKEPYGFSNNAKAVLAGADYSLVQLHEKHHLRGRA